MTAQSGSKTSRPYETLSHTILRLIGWSRYGDNLVVQSDFYDLQRETERRRQSAQAEFIDDEDDFQPVKQGGAQRNSERDGEGKSMPIPTAKIPKKSKNDQRQRETAHTDRERERETVIPPLPKLADPDWVEEQTQRHRQRQTERLQNPVGADTEEDSEDDKETKMETEAASAASLYGRRPPRTAQQTETERVETKRRDTEKGQRDDKTKHPGPPPLPERAGMREGQRESQRETVRESDRDGFSMGEGLRETHGDGPVRCAGYTAMLYRAGSASHLNKR